jgi:hypothetical protein
MRASDRTLTGLVLAAAVVLLLPAAAGAGGFGGRAGFGNSGYGHSSGGTFSGPRATKASPGHRVSQRLKAISSKRQLQVKRDGLEIRRTLRTMKRQSDVSRILRSGSSGDLQRYARRVRLEDSVNDLFLGEELREGLRRDAARRGLSPHHRAAVRVWGRPRPGSYAVLREALERRRFQADLDLKVRSEGLAREFADRQRDKPRLRVDDSRSKAMRSLLSPNPF